METETKRHDRSRRQKKQKSQEGLRVGAQVPERSHDQNALFALLEKYSHLCRRLSPEFSSSLRVQFHTHTHTSKDEQHRERKSGKRHHYWVSSYFF